MTSAEIIAIRDTLVTTAYHTEYWWPAMDLGLISRFNALANRVSGQYTGKLIENTLNIDVEYLLPKK